MATVSIRSSFWQRFASGLGLLVIAGVLLGGAGLLTAVGQWRIDLTQGKIYTLSEGTRRIIQQLPEPVMLTLYVSESQMRDIPVLRNYAKRVQEMLREYERYSDGKIVLRVVEPEPFSEQEDAAAAAGLQGVPNGKGETLYFGLAGSRGDKSEKVIFFNPQKENVLEYDISQLVYRLGRVAPVTVGVITGLPVFRSMDYKTNRPRPAWLITDQLQQLFDIRRQIDTNVDKIDDDLNVLLVIHPHLLPEKTLFAIDQFVLRGGRVLVFVDPYAEQDDSEVTFGEGFADRSSSLDQLFAAWGIDYDPKKVVLDLGYAHSIAYEPGGQEVPHVGVLGLEGEAINREQNVIAELENINIASAGALAAQSGSTTQFSPLLFSSRQTQLMDAGDYGLVGRHDELLRKMKPGNQQYVFAALVSGPVKTAFPQGKPATSQYSGTVLTESQQPLQAIVVADTDLLADRMWVERQDFYGQVMASPFAANGDMLVNMVDALGGSADLITLRSRGTYQRPFTRVNELEKAASSRLREQEDALMQALSETEKKIAALNQPGSDEDPSATANLTPEQQAEIARFQQEKVRIRRNLRDVQHQLNSDVEQLGVVLKVINIAAVPVLLTLLAVVAAWLRARRARRG